MSSFTFGVVLHGSSTDSEFRETVRRADQLGCDLLAAPDHLGAPDPFAVLAAAAQVTERLRLRTYVLNVGFWNAALLARAAATVDLLSGGRLELGLGAGYMRSEHEDAGLPWQAHRVRTQQMEHTLIEVRRRLSDHNHRPRAAQARLPIAVGAMTSPGLGVAARNADVVAFSGLLQVPGAAPGSFTLASSDQTHGRVREVRHEAAGRSYSSDALLHIIRLGGDPQIAAEQLAVGLGNMSAAQLLDTPFVLLARDASHAAEILIQRHEDFGFDCFTTHEPNLEALGQVIAAC